MDLQYTLQRYALQLKNQPRTLRGVARVFQKRFIFDGVDGFLVCQ